MEHGMVFGKDTGSVHAIPHCTNIRTFKPPEKWQSAPFR
jgi:hypothetical protein